MRHENYVAEIRYDDEEKLFFGNVVNFPRTPQGVDGIGFEGRSVDELQSDFEAQVDFYREVCRKDGREPALG